MWVNAGWRNQLLGWLKVFAWIWRTLSSIPAPYSFPDSKITETRQGWFINSIVPPTVIFVSRARFPSTPTWCWARAPLLTMP